MSPAKEVRAGAATGEAGAAVGGRTDGEKIEVRLAGFGGQGVVLAGMILGKAVTLYQGANAVMTQSYGPEARGGACSADVIISPRRINYPRVSVPDVLVLMSEEAARTYGPGISEKALVLVNEDLVKSLPAGEAVEIFKIPATGIAEKLGRVIVANIVMLGFIAAVAGVVGFEAMRQAALSSIPPGTEELNLAALQAGYDYGSSLTAGPAGDREEVGGR
jgi:2-oxoglutarate ferredoxin oxidoreductase subunit gamma